METSLELVFLATDGKTVRIVVNDPREDLTEADIQQEMNNILSANVFTNSSGASLASIKEARLVNRSIQTYEF